MLSEKERQAYLFIIEQIRLAIKDLRQDNAKEMKTMDNRTIDEIRKNETVLINELKRKEDVINKARKYVKENSIYFAIKDKIGNYFANCNCDELLEILDDKGE